MERHYLIERNQIGRFRIDRDVISENPDGVMKILKFMCVIKAEMLFECDGIQYTAYSRKFAEHDRNQITPNYEIQFTEGEDGFEVFRL